MRQITRLLVVLLFISTGWIMAVSSGGTGTLDDRKEVETLYHSGNFQEALTGFRRMCLDPNSEGGNVAGDLPKAVHCLQRLGRIHEVDDLLEDTVRAHSHDWRVLRVVAEQYQGVPQQGFLIAGEYRRGPHRGGGKLVFSGARDRVRALQLMSRAMPLVRNEDRKDQVASFYLSLANMLERMGEGNAAWRLQILSDLSSLPDLEEGFYRGVAVEGAPVDAEGRAVFHRVPQSWADAKTDGQRWRWALAEAVENSPAVLNNVRWRLAQFLHQQFGVQTMRQGFIPRDLDEEDESGTYALRTLGEEETIARLATGIQRFRLPDEFNFIRILQEIANEPRTGHGENALEQLAQIFENRRQYATAAEYWRRSIDLYGSGNKKWKQRRLDQIVRNWGRFETQMTEPAGQGVAVEFVFRNADEVRFEAHEIHVAKLLEDVKSYLRRSPERIEGRKAQFENLGWRLVQNNEQQYLGRRVASWSETLQPREFHFDRRVTIKTPLKEPGAYLLTARVNNGNVSKIVVWVADTAIVQKNLTGGSFYFVADAVSGEPIAKANLEFFGYRQISPSRGKFRILTTNFAERTDANGQVKLAHADLPQNYQWLVIARTAQGRFAYQGFRGVWGGRHHDAEYNQVKTFCITDRPVYRPAQTLHFKFWVRQAQYDKEDVSQFAGRSFTVELYDPKGEKIEDWTLKADEYGGMEGDYEIPDDATLGRYRLQVADHGGGGDFRVEEYKKPEFEVTVEAPDKPVMLGEKITATIQAKYYFGSPVTNATVKYKILRNEHSQDWYPLAPWDWFYGRGYWWFAYDCPWYPGWHDWVGCFRPIGWWWPRRHNPPEIVAEQEVAIGEDGLVDIEIDTAIAKALHGDTDHQYTITAEVRDESRRTIVGQGKVLVARKPFKVFTWVDRGYYRVGETIRSSFVAQTLDNKPVTGDGVLTLFKVTYDGENRPVETPQQRWDINIGDTGRAELPLQASTKGQYRLSLKVTDSEQHTIEGGYLFTVIGDGFDGREFRFNNIELIPDKREYAAGDRVRLQINTDRAGSTVLLFVRPSNGVYLPPQVLRLDGKSTVREVAVVKKDMPNFFVEAVTLADGKVHSDIKEIVVPPEKRILNVEVLPSAETYKPGEPAQVKVHLTELNGESFQGTTVVSVYDKSVEYISGGSNVGDIREFFWKWRRHHHLTQQTTLDRRANNRQLPNTVGMSAIGVFGHSVADEFDSRFKGFAVRGEGMMPGMASMSGMGRMGGMGGGMMFDAGDMAPAGGMAAPMAAMEGMGEGESGGLGGSDANGRVDSGDLIAPEVRSEFADTALWVGSLKTDDEGFAEVSLDMPENLTTWKVKVWGMGHGTKVGSGEAEVVTRKNLILRLQAPRFLVQNDQAVLSANIHNYLDRDKDVRAVLALVGEELAPLDPPQVTVRVPANGEKRVDWRVRVRREGTAKVQMQALTDEESDAVHVAGQEIRYSPTLAGAMVDALPYLADYPYGCTEQTLNRFLPSVITQKVLLELNLNLDEIGAKRTNLNAQELGGERERAKQWRRFERNPVFDRDELNRMVKEGLTALTNMQVSDGGWGWFSGYGERSYPHTTAVVVHGLQIAQQNDVALVPGVLERGVEWLKRYQADQVQRLKNAAQRIKPWKHQADNLDAFVYMVLVDADLENEPMRDYLYRDRTELAVYSMAMFGLALHDIGDEPKLAMILRNLRQYLVQDEENETAYLRLPSSNSWWNWYGSETEAIAYYLKLLARREPGGVTAPRLVKYLLNNRKHGTYWNSTRDTAVCVEAFADYIRATGEARPDMVVEIWIDGQLQKAAEITAENLFTFDNKFLLLGGEVAEGEHVIEIRRRGTGPVYFNAFLTNFTLEDPITRTGLEIKIARRYYQLIPVDKAIQVAGRFGQALDRKVEKYKRMPLKNLDRLTSGDLVEVELEIESKNDYEYLMFEDLKAAGFEPVEVRSGYAQNGLGAYMELRDERVTFFVRRLARGRHSIAYRLRAEIPGRFSALPALGQGMYAPELVGNSDEMKLQIED